MKLLLILIHLFILIAQSYSKEELNLYSARQEVLMRPLIKLFEDEYKIVVAPGPKEIDMTKEINAITILNQNNSLNIQELASLIKDSSFVISNDTGPAHISSHLGVKGVALFGSHTTAYKVSIERENFKAIQVTDLNKLSPEKVFEYFLQSLN